MCMSSALIDEHVNIGGDPGKLGHAWTDLLIKAPDSLFEQSTLLGVQAEEDTVVISDNQKNVLSENT